MVKKIFAVLAICFLSSTAVLADPAVDLTRIPGYYSGSGGEFQLTPNQELTDLTGEVLPYSSFCLEKTEYVSVGGTYDVVVATEAILGGGNDGPTGPQGGDALDPMTAYLYKQFRSGTLAGYDYNPSGSRSASAGALQQVIWYIEDEGSKTWTDGDSSRQDQYYQAALGSGWTGIGNVRVLNLYAQGHVGEAGYYKQDQLALTVPVPGAALLCSLGMGTVGWFRRRRL
jgi:hypothetical protein